jgi:surface protein
MGSNSVPITAPEILTAFNNNPAGTIFTPSIVTSYGSDESGNAVSAVSTPSVLPNFIPKKITPTLSLANLPNKLPTDSPFSLSVTTNSGGVLSYQSSLVSVATVNSSGLVTIVGAGTTTITVSLEASSDGLYAAASVSKQLVVALPPSPITLAANGVTIQYNGTAGDIPSSTPLFIQANPRGTLQSGVPQPEWFAVVNDSSSAQITSYAKSAGSAVSAYFTPPEESGPVPFKNIVTTLMTNMSGIFDNARAFDQDISSWDTSTVTHMIAMFAYAQAFNNNGSPNIGSWDTSKVRDMSLMFYNASVFNKNLSGWNVALTIARPSLTRTSFATGSPLALAENSAKLPLFQ